MYIVDASKQYKYKHSPCRLLVQSYRDESGIPRRRTILNLSKLPQNLANTIEQSVSGQTMVPLEEITQEDNRSLGEVIVLKRLADRLGLTKVLNDNLGKRVASLTLSLAINRISLPKAKYSIREWVQTTYLPEILNLTSTDYHHNTLYQVLEQLADRQELIETALWQETKTREQELTLMLYDLSSTYLEGQQNELAEWGYNRDKKKGRKQINLALVTTPQGRPVTIEVLPGNVTDKTTLLPKIRKLKQRFAIKDLIYVFDRGMGDQGKLEALRSQQVKYITALTKSEIRQLVDQYQEAGRLIQPGLFDQQDLAEYQTQDDQGHPQRYIICRSDVATRSIRTREVLLKKTEEKLAMIKRNVDQGRRRDPVKISAWAERWLQRWKMKKYFKIEVKEGRFTYQRQNQLINQAEELDRFYVLETNDTHLTPAQVQRGYKNLAVVESDFRTLKSYLDIRPVHHRKEATVRGHVFICFLGLYLRKELEIRLQPLLKENTFSYLLTRLREIRQSRLVAGQHQTYLINQLGHDQKQILNTLQMRILPLAFPFT